MASNLEDIQTDVNNYLVKVKQFQESLDTDASQNTMYINSDTLSSLVNLTVIMTSLGTAMDGYGVMIGSLQVFTSDRTLTASMESMLNMSSDIGQMSNSILEMADVILLMSDNIGLEADQILLTQELQSINIAAAQSSILASQLLAIGIIESIN
jgi:hypothetical protein